MGLEVLEFKERLHAKIDARSSAVSAESCVMKKQMEVNDKVENMRKISERTSHNSCGAKLFWCLTEAQANSSMG